LARLPAKIEPIQTIREFLMIRDIRNECREFFTGSNQYLDLAAQIAFYRNKPDNIDIYAFREDDKILAYLALRHELGCTYITEAVSKEARRLGIATELIAFAKTLHTTLYARILNNNSASVALHTTQGFQLVTHGERDALYRWTRYRA
jgi:GNAT superfamily N-acetyltransferase